MVRRTTRLRGTQDSVDVLARRFAAIRSELEVPAAFPADVEAAAARAAQQPDLPVGPDADARDIPFVTVDPAGSTDLDQALHLARGAGWVVHYAIADVPAFVPDGGPVDGEARHRGETLYAPDGRTPLHPTVLSEGAASLLQDQDRPAFVWRFELDATGEVTATGLRRALVRNRHRLDYDTVQAAADAHPAPDGGAADLTGLDDVSVQSVLLREVGQARLAREAARGGASLGLPEQEVVAQDGRYRLELHPPLPSEGWNAQLSLMTGMAAAAMMLQARVGVLRTMPAPDDAAVERYRRQVAALGVPWPRDVPYGAFLRRLDPSRAADLAALHAAGALFRGAGYTPLDGSLPEGTTHAAVAAPYAHVTAPLRRLVDRFGLLVCAALASGGGAEAVPPDVRAALPQLPAAMQRGDHLSGELDRRCTDTVEAAVLADRVGEGFDAVCVDVNGHGADQPASRGKVQVLDPAVLAGCDGPLRLGDAVRVRLVTADVDTGTVRFTAEPS